MKVASFKISYQRTPVKDRAYASVNYLDALDEPISYDGIDLRTGAGAKVINDYYRSHIVWSLPIAYGKIPVLFKKDSR